MKSVFEFDNVVDGKKVTDTVEMYLPAFISNGSKLKNRKTGLMYVVCDSDIEVEGTNIAIHYKTCLVPSQ